MEINKKLEILMEEPIDFTISGLQDKYRDKNTMSVNECLIAMDRYGLYVAEATRIKCIDVFNKTKNDFDVAAIDLFNILNS